MEKLRIPKKTGDPVIIENFSSDVNLKWDFNGNSLTEKIHETAQNFLNSESCSISPEALDACYSRIHLPPNVDIEALELGDPAGHPALYFHGWPSAANEVWPLHAAAKQNGLRLIAINRPGYGRSTPVRLSSFTSWAEYVEKLVLHLNLGSIQIIAMSGGTPFGLACAAQLGNKVIGVHVVSGLGPAHENDVLRTLNPGIRALLRIGRNAPFLGRLGLASAGILVRTFPGIPENILPFDPHLSSSDLEVLTDRKLKGLMSGIALKAFQQGSFGPWQDGFLYCRPWNIPFEKIGSHCRFWHGTCDGVTSVYMIEKLTRQIPDAELNVFDGKGHFSTPWARPDLLVKSVLGMT